MRTVLFEQDTNDHHRLRASEKQFALVRCIAAEQNVRVPDHVLTGHRSVSGWIDAHKPKTRPAPTRFFSDPSSKHMAFPEHIARIKRVDVPRECFKSFGSLAATLEGLEVADSIRKRQFTNLEFSGFQQFAGPAG